LADARHQIVIVMIGPGKGGEKKRTHFKHPQGVETRGKTAPNRLRRVDNFVAEYDPQLLTREDGPYRQAFFVDLGYGFYPTTTMESAARFRRLNPQLPILGVEIDRLRVRYAQQHYSSPLNEFRLGGFNIPLQQREDGRMETIRLIRAFNVLRQYETEAEVKEAHELMSSCLLPGGLIIEGTSDPFGRIWVANVLRKSAKSSWLQIEALVFSTNFRWGFDPAMFQPVLPKNFIHRMKPNEMIFNFMEDWKLAYEEVGVPMRAMSSLPQIFTATGEHLALHFGYRVETRRKWLRQGFLIWYLRPGEKGVVVEQIANYFDQLQQVQQKKTTSRKKT
jgi:hypothetical protein